MGFWDTVGGSAAQSLGAGIVGAGLGAAFGGDNGPSKSDIKYAQERNMELGTYMAQLGNRLDVENQQTMYDYRLQAMEDRGLTSVEMFGSPASGSGGGTTGTGPTLGNAGISAQSAMQQQRQQAKMVASENQKDRMTQLATAAIQAGAQKDVAEIGAGVQTRGQDLQKQIADNVLSLNTRELNEVKIPQAAEQLQLTRQQLQTEINKTATSSERFQTAMKQLSMGPANLLVELTMRDKGISLSDDSFMKMSEEQRAQVLSELTAMASTLYVEARGFETVTDKVKQSAEGTADSIADMIADLVIKATGGKGIEATNAPPNMPSLGSRMSEPYQSGPNMRYR